MREIVGATTAPPGRRRRGVRRDRQLGHAALCARAFGPERIARAADARGGLVDETLRPAPARHRCVRHRDRAENITPILAAAGCYERRDDAVRAVNPGVRRGLAVQDRAAERARDRALPAVLGRRASPRRRDDRARLPAGGVLAIVAATNFKQRTRKMLEYFHADRLELRGRSARRTGSSTTRASSSSSATVPPTSSRSRICTRRRSTSWRSTSACPSEIRARPPTTDTYSLPQRQDEFYFSLPHDKMDLACTRATTGCRPRTWRRRSGSRPSRSSACTRTSTRSGARRATCTSSPQLVAPVPSIHS